MTRLHLSLLALLSICNDAELYHYHRYMLSEYKPQHSHALQSDYKPMPRPIYSDEEYLTAPEDVELNVEDGKTTIVQQLMVRIFANDKYICMGMLVDADVVISTYACIQSAQSAKFTIQTIKNKVFKLRETVTRLSNSPLVVELHLAQPPIDSMFRPQLCPNKLNAGVQVLLSIYRHNSVLSELANVVPLKDCRALLNDTFNQYTDGQLICIKNERKSAACQKNYGAPLIYKNNLCGINLLGHRCLRDGKLDLYAFVLNETAYTQKALSSVHSLNIEDVIL
ncbi:uncharacterized protein LOC111596151 [Drosophila hydei]|uniref:Uncharacterized protein LOC111596151 n=1 Tax=Drosophila hydei TaxID=7224 RepID=A0A6J1LMJ4_DROHY|nr:uncharacterized protein LOC111596151 [Drosophila hydei]